MSKSKSKIRKLIAGKRPFSKRILLAFLPSLALSFTILFFGPLDLVYISQNYVAYSPLKILPIMAGVMCGAFLLLLLPASVIGGSIHAFLVSLYTGIALASYLQGALLNPNFGTLDGHTVNWVDFSGLMARNLLIWVLIILVPFFINDICIADILRKFLHFLAGLRVGCIEIQAIHSLFWYAAILSCFLCFCKILI